MPTIAERVRSLIEQRDQTQSAFAAEIGLDPTKLSKSLSGVRRFSSLDLALIAETCGVTVDWLLTGDDVPVAVAARAAAGSPAADALTLARHYATVRSDLASLGYQQGWRTPEAPRLGGTWKHQGAELAAAASAQLARTGDILTEPLADLIERAFGVDVGVEPLGDGMDGLAVATPELKLILAAPSAVPARQRFTIAHELGHLLASDDQQIHTDADIYRTDRVESEIRANAFAAHLLMPTPQLREVVQPGFDRAAFCELATTWRVSPSSLAARLEELRLIDAGTADGYGSISAAQASREIGQSGLVARLAAESTAIRPPGLLLRDALAAYEDGQASLRLYASLLGVSTDSLRAQWEAEGARDA